MVYCCGCHAVLLLSFLYSTHGLSAERVSTLTCYSALCGLGVCWRWTKRKKTFLVETPDSPPTLHLPTSAVQLQKKYCMLWTQNIDSEGRALTWSGAMMMMMMIRLVTQCYSPLIPASPLLVTLKGPRYRSMLSASYRRTIWLAGISQHEPGGGVKSSLPVYYDVASRGWLI